MIPDNGQRENDWSEFAVLIHGIQCRVLAQAACRAMPTEFRPLGGWPTKAEAVTPP